MTNQAIFHSLCYELGLFLVRLRPSLAQNAFIKSVMEWCRPEWAAWKASIAMERIDKEARTLVSQWEEESRNEMANRLFDKAKELFPAAKVTPLPNASVPSVMIEEAPPDSASDAVKALGGEMRITWTLDRNPAQTHGR